MYNRIMADIDEQCEYCETTLISCCLQCGAPVCCPKCCDETTEQLFKQNYVPAVSSKDDNFISAWLVK